MTLSAYSIVKVIGKGSFGRALLVRRKSTGKQYVVKVRCGLFTDRWCRGTNE